jgi:hypothetical protein
LSDTRCALTEVVVNRRRRSRAVIRTLALW